MADSEDPKLESELGLVRRLKAAMAERALTVTALAERLGVQRGALSTRLNSGRMDEEELLRIAALLGRSPAYLRYGIPDDVAGHPRGYFKGMNDAAQAMLATVLQLQTRISAALSEAPATPSSEAIAGGIAALNHVREHERQKSKRRRA